MMKFTDRASVGSIKKTREGYLVATARVARTGIQDYHSSELGMSGDKIVKVYRSPDEVFHKDALATLTRVPVTIDHPAEMVTSENWKDIAVGEVGDAYSRDGEWVVVNPMIKDAAALIAAETTHKEISMGYTAELRDAAPETGADYEMYNLRFNHLALVPSGRAGSQARIGDAKFGATPIIVEDSKMTVELKTVILGDKAVSVEAKDADTVAAILKDHKTIVDGKDKQIGELTIKLADAEAKVVSDETLGLMVVAKVKADTERAAVVAKVGDKAAVWTDAQIEGAYLALDAGVVVDDAMRKALADKKAPVNDAQSYEDRIAVAQRKFLNLEAK